MTSDAPVVAIVLAAGMSSRMGDRFKLTLPWDGGTVIGQVVSTLQAAAVDQILVVVGNRQEEVRAALRGTHAQCVVNPDYASGEMLSSIRAGLRAADETCRAALLCLGDQPQMQISAVRTVLAEGMATDWEAVVMPSYGMRTGHPILLPRGLWSVVCESSGTLRDVLRTQRKTTRYAVVDTPSVLADLDTPADYSEALSSGRPDNGEADEHS